MTTLEIAKALTYLTERLTEEVRAKTGETQKDAIKWRNENIENLKVNIRFYSEKL